MSMTSAVLRGQISAEINTDMSTPNGQVKMARAPIQSLSQSIGQKRRIFDHVFVSLQALANGLGIDIGPLPVLQSDLTSDRLITPFPDIIMP